jgi:hypothetical protein
MARSLTRKIKRVGHLDGRTRGHVALKSAVRLQIGYCAKGLPSGAEHSHRNRVQQFHRLLQESS